MSMIFITLFAFIVFSVVTFGYVLCAIETNPFYWILAACFDFAAITKFLEFLAMC